jgi:peptidoglycan/LPS O-acetylase OafA/YrhL
MSAFSNTIVLNNNFVYNSDLFVDFFFVLSGFVITYTAQGMSAPGDMKLFYKKRLFRLYPLHFIMLMIFVVIEFVKKFFVGRIQVNQLNNANNNITTFFSNLFLLNSVKMPGVTDVSWNIPSWSISAEMLSYILFGSAVWFIHRFNMYKNRVYLFAAIALGSLFLLHAVAGDFRLTYSFDYGFLRGFIGFFTGAVCFNFFSSTREKVITKPTAFFHAAEVFCIAAMVIMVYNGFALKPYGYVFEILFFLSIYVFAFEKGIVSSLFKKSGFLKKVGTYSYSIYMTHALLLSLFNIVFIRLLKLPPSSYLYMFVLNYVLIYFVSQWTYKHIELKFQLKKK